MDFLPCVVCLCPAKPFLFLSFARRLLPKQNLAVLTWGNHTLQLFDKQGDQWWSGTDRLGSARVHTDELGEQVTYLAYFTAFGERMDVGLRTVYTFAGDWGYRDGGGMGLLHVGARYSDPFTAVAWYRCFGPGARI
ncbi:MAG: hypothetical protein KatS3mg022_1021 [Armatimonadota bacterium]|nr:MAG: hypothetical protein KatS3mg022_1021 [Armatimonadota bacterium]